MLRARGKIGAPPGRRYVIAVPSSNTPPLGPPGGNRTPQSSYLPLAARIAASCEGVPGAGMVQK